MPRQAIEVVLRPDDVRDGQPVVHLAYLGHLRPVLEDDVGEVQEVGQRDCSERPCHSE